MFVVLLLIILSFMSIAFYFLDRNGNVVEEKKADITRQTFYLPRSKTEGFFLVFRYQLQLFNSLNKTISGSFTNEKQLEIQRKFILDLPNKYINKHKSDLYFSKDDGAYILANKNGIDLVVIAYYEDSLNVEINIAGDKKFIEEFIKKLKFSAIIFERSNENEKK